MKVIIDTSVWSLVLRRPRPDPKLADAVRRLSLNQVAITIGPVRQETLSGVASRQIFERLKQELRLIPDEPIESADYESAAELFNRCRNRGIQGDHADFLIVAVAQRLGAKIFTTDRDFENFATVLPIDFLNEIDLAKLPLRSPPTS